MSCSTLNISRRFGRTCLLHLQRRGITSKKQVGSRTCFAYSSALKMVAICSSETSVGFLWTTQRYVPEDRMLHNVRCENLKCTRLHGVTFQEWFLLLLSFASYFKQKLDTGPVANAEHYVVFLQVIWINTRETSPRIRQGVGGYAALCADVRSIRRIRLSLDISESSDELILPPGSSRVCYCGVTVYRRDLFFLETVRSNKVEPMNRKGLSESDALATR
jgi:hypothetical protein